MKKYLSIILLTFLLLNSVVFAETVEIKLTEEEIVDNTEETITKLDKVMPLSEELFEWATGDSGTVYSYTEDDKESIIFTLLEKKEITLYPITFDGINKDRAVKLILSDAEQQEENPEAKESEQKEEVIQEASNNDDNKEGKETKSKDGNSEKVGQAKESSSNAEQSSNTNDNKNGDIASSSENSTPTEQNNQSTPQPKSKNENDTSKEVVAVDSNTSDSQNPNNENNNTGKEDEKKTTEEVKISDTQAEEVSKSKEEGKKSNVIGFAIPAVLVIGVAGLVLSKKKGK